MFNVTFYNFSKRYNSTKRPADGSGTAYSCRVLDGTAIINPKIVLDIGLTADPSNFNYAYIPNFGRYYHIKEWTFDRGLWIANMNVDVLATYKTQIGDANLYVLRAANDYDGTIIDTKYPTKTGCSYDSTTITNPYANPETGGCYIVGCVSKTGNFGSIEYYAMTGLILRRLMTALMDNTVTEDNGFSWSDASQALQLSIVDPIQYIKSAVWVPFDYSEVPGDDERVLTVFNWSPLVGPNPHKVISKPNMTKTWTFNLKKHPDTAARGNYVNCSPYTVVTLSFPPFGVIELDTTVLCDATTITVKVNFDLISGHGALEVWAHNTLLNKVDSTLGVPIQLSQITRDYLGTLNNVLGSAGSIASGVGSIMGGNVAGGVGSFIGAAQGVVSAYQSMVPRSNTIGAGGCYSVLLQDPGLYFQFFRPVADDLAHNGRPLCQMRLPKNLGGYMIIQDGDVATSGTQAENEQIQTMLESGFYYE